MKRFYKCSISIVLIFLLMGCNNSNGINSNKEKFDYSRFTSIVKTFNDEFNPVEYDRASEDEPLVAHITTFPDTKLDSRTNDGVNGDTAKPSKYELFYIKKDTSVLVKVSFLYSSQMTSGIICQSITSPVDNVELKEKYKVLDRPFLINKILSRGDYLISFEYMLLNPDKIKKTNDKKIQYLIDSDGIFYESIEKFILEHKL